MFERSIDRRALVSLSALLLLGACQLVPQRPVDQPPAPAPTPDADALPADSDRHRIALLVPLSGPSGGLGQSIANAAMMALLDTNARNIRLTTYDTAAGAGDAAAKAIADGSRLVLGPLLAQDIAAVAAQAQPVKVPVIAFAGDETAARRDVFIMGLIPAQSISRTVAHARSQGAQTFAALVPRGDYGQRAAAALAQAARENGAAVVASEAYDRGNTSVISAARRLREKGGYDAVLIADGSRIAVQAAPSLKSGTPARLIGTELWSGEASVAKAPGLEGAWFSAVPDTRFRQFSTSYRARFAAQPHRTATLGYDAVLLTLRVARDWPMGRPFPTGKLLARDGFLGLDGPFRFVRGGIVERALEVREIRRGGLTVVSPAPTGFED